jgi:putative SOS response-associated peptidase YedK
LGDGPHLVYGFLTTSPNAVVEPIHPKAMPVTLTTEEECEGVEPERDGAHEFLERRKLLADVQSHHFSFGKAPSNRGCCS